MSSRKVSRKTTIVEHTESTCLVVLADANKPRLIANELAAKKPFSIYKFLSTIVSSITVEPAPFLYAFGVMLYIPVLSNMCMNKLCRQYCGYSIDQCRAFDTGANKTIDIHVKQIWTVFDGLSTALGTVPSIIFALFIGPWSDVFGRKAPMAVPFVGTMLAVSVTALLYFLEWLPVWMLVLPNVLQSSCGGMASLLMGAFSYAADLSSCSTAAGTGSDCSRTLRIAMIEVGVIMGFAAGGIAGGAIVSAGLEHFWCYIISFCTAVAGSAYIFVRIHEIRRPTSQYCSAYEALTSVFDTQNIAASFATITDKRAGHARQNLWLLLIALFTNSAVSMGEDGVMQKFLTGAPLHWSLPCYMNYQSFATLLSVLVVSCLMLAGKKNFRLNDSTIGIIGCLSRICYASSIAVATETWAVYRSGAMGVGRYAIPVALRALISKLVPKDEQGKVFSLVSAAEAVSPLVGTIAVTAIFTATSGWWPGFFELVSAFVTIVPLALLCVVKILECRCDAAKSEIRRHDDEKKKPVFDDTVRLHKISQTISVYV